MAYEQACRREVEPWYHLAVQTDASGADPTGFSAGGGTPSPETKAMAALFVAGETDPVIGRALARVWNLLALPTDIAADPETTARMAAVFADPDAYPPQPRSGPTRSELLASLAAAPEATHA